MAANNLKSTLDFNNEGLNFDPVSFMTSIFSTIDDNRSDMGSNPSDIIETPLNHGVGTRAEPRINAFLRLLGMPAVRDEALFTADAVKDNAALSGLVKDQARKSNALSQNDTLNYFASIGSLHGDLVDGIDSRNQILSRKITAEGIQKMIDDPLPLDASIQSKVDQRRAPLFPLVVDASIPVFPLKKRVAPLFNDGDYIMLGGQQKLMRPFLQHIIYIRTKVYSGIPNNLSDSLKSNILSEVGPGIITDLDLQNYTFLELRVLQRFIEAIRSSVRGYTNTIRDIKRIKAEITYSSLPVDNPEERSGSQTITDDVKFKSNLDNQIQSINTMINFEDLFLLTLPTDSVNKSDTIRRIEDQITLNNVSQDALISEFTSLLTYDRDALVKKKQILEQQRSFQVQRLERARRALSYYTGEFYGLSIIDVLGVLYALFRVDVSVLMGLLNSSAQKRLLKDPFYSTTNLTNSDFSLSELLLGTALPLEGALTSVNAKVKEAFAIATSFAQRIDSPQTSNQSPVGK